MDPDLCVHCGWLWRAGHQESCPQLTNVYPVTEDERGMVCAECREPLSEHYTTTRATIHCLGCAATGQLIGECR